VASSRTTAGAGGDAISAGPPAANVVTRPAVGLLTPAGRGAIAVVRVSGPGSIQVADLVFRTQRGVSLALTTPGRLRLGRVGPAPGDEVVAVLLDGQPPAVELQCHGGALAAEMVIDALEQAGAERSDPALLVNTWTDDPIAAEATLDLCQAPTLKTAEILLEQAEGALRRELLGLTDLIDQDPSPAPALQYLDELIGRSAFGLRLLAGWKVVIAGRPNVGKSRLLNALAGFTRAIVDPTPGTTRDIVTLSTALGGWPIELADTAGLRDAGDPIEAEGIARSWREQDNADLLLAVLDRSEALQPTDLELVASAGRAIVVANKSDLPAAWETAVVHVRSKPVRTISAERGDGIAELCAEIVRSLVPDAPKPGDGVPFRTRHVQALERARQCLIERDRSTAKVLLEAVANKGVRNRFPTPFAAAFDSQPAATVSTERAKASGTD
jgi:tRNA modification GTPase